MSRAEVGRRVLIAVPGALVLQAGLAAEPGTAFRDCDACPTLIVIPAGQFEMGSDSADAEPDERPRHRVSIAAPFAAARDEVTVGEFRRFVDATGHDTGAACSLVVDGEWRLTAGRSWHDPGYPQGDDEPVACVSWNDAIAYAAWVSALAGANYRLLSEAEWEYLARAGGDDPPANREGGEFRFTAPGGRHGADPFGLHDVRGNVWEWLADCYHDSYRSAPVDGRSWTDECSDPTRRALRGGSWNDGPELLRAGYRLRGPVDGRYFTLGFRLARDLP